MSEIAFCERAFARRARFQFIMTKIRLFLLWALLGSGFGSASGETRTEHVFLITLDGLRWEEVFTGAEAALIGPDGGVANTNSLAREFWRDDPGARREALMPFVWQVMAREGQLLGNRQAGSRVRVTNGKNFTYPGFNEILTGFADPRIDSNAKRANPNVTVLEWLNQREGFQGKVAAFPNWDTFPYILNAERAKIPVWTGYPEDLKNPRNPILPEVRKMFADITPLWDGMNFDFFFHHAVMDYVEEKQPSVVWIAFSETDEWAHEGRYDLYLRAANRIDGYVRELWEKLQSMPHYRGKTAFILTTDHGRGSGPAEWRNHGAAVKGAEDIWIAALGPDIPAKGSREHIPDYGQNQIAATIAAWLGEDYAGAVPRAGQPIPDLIRGAEAEAPAAANP